MVSSKALIDEFVSLPALALIGMSRSDKKFGNFAYRSLVSKGYRVYPIHPSVGSIRGVRCYSQFADLPERVEAVLVVVPPAQAINAVREAASAAFEWSVAARIGIAGSPESVSRFGSGRDFRGVYFDVRPPFQLSQSASLGLGTPG